MRAKVAAFCRKEALFAPNEEVCCAVSGGADSMALLWCLHTLREELQIRVSAVHFNHRLRAEADGEEVFVREFCKMHDIALRVGSADVAAYAKEQRIGTEEAARLCRYRFFSTLGCKIATAHHADDNLETVLMHLVRGSGLRGLCGIAPKREGLVRPLLCLTRAEILEFLRSEGISWVEDESNRELSYTRNRLRHEVLPLLHRENPRLSALVAEQSCLLRAEDELLDDLALDLLESSRQKNGFAVQSLLAAPDALQKRALRCMLRAYLPQDVSLVHVEALQALLRNPNPSARLCLPMGVTAQRAYDLICISRQERAVFPETELQIPGQTCIEQLGWCISCEIIKNFENFANTPFHFAVKYDMISQTKLIARARRTGDVLRTSGGHRKSLKKLYIDRKIPHTERDILPVITDGERVLAAAGIGVDFACVPAMGQTAVLIHIQKEEIAYDS